MPNLLVIFPGIKTLIQPLIGKIIILGTFPNLKGINGPLINGRFQAKWFLPIRNWPKGRAFPFQKKAFFGLPIP